jgi:NADPH:quinone reductase-like Zn-dependent oxidoreductase
MPNRRVLISRHGGPEVLEVVDDALPEPKAGEVRVRVVAAGVSFADLLMRRGLYRPAPPLPFTPGYDIVGTVDRNGDGAAQFAPGRMVAALTVTGGCAQYLNVAESELVPVPEGLDPAAAVSLILNYVTAWQLLHRAASPPAGARVLVHAAAGGVGTAVLELGKLAGFELFGTASKPKHAVVSSRGAVPIDYRSEDFLARIRELTGDGVDLALDPIGGMTWWRSYRALRSRGTLLAYGISSIIGPSGARRAAAVGSFALLGAMQLIPDGRSARFYAITTMKKQHPDWFREDLAGLFDLLARKKVTPLVEARLPLAAAARAQQLLERGETTGKLVLLPQE